MYFEPSVWFSRSIHHWKALEEYILIKVKTNPKNGRDIVNFWPKSWSISIFLKFYKFSYFGHIAAICVQNGSFAPIFPNFGFGSKNTWIITLKIHEYTFIVEYNKCQGVLLFLGIWRISYYRSILTFNLQSARFFKPA